MISTGGIFSGLDTQAIIEQLVAVERTNQDPVSRARTRANQEKTAVLELNTKLTSLVSSLRKLDGLDSAGASVLTEDEILTTTSASSREEAVGIESSESAAPGVYTVSVSRLATAARRDHSGTADATASLSGSDAVFAFSYAGGDVQTIDIVGGETTLEDVRDGINALDAGVRATIVDTGVVGATRHRLVLDGEDTGQANTVTIDASTTLTGFADGDFGSVAPLDANFSLNGVAIVSASNQPSPVAGVTLDLKEEGGADVTLTVEQDVDALKGKLKDVVKNVNSVLTFLRDQSRFNTSTNSAGVLSGDTLIQRVGSTLRRALSFQVGSGKYTSLADLGLEFDREGNVSFDSETLDEALTDPEAVRDLLRSTVANTPDGLGAQIVDEIKSYTDTTSGLLQDRIKSLDSRIELFDSRLEVLETRVGRYRTRLEKQFTRLEQALASLSGAQQFFQTNQIGIY